MPRDKVETTNQLKTKGSNGSSKTTSKVSSISNNEDVKKSKELSTDRSNIRMNLSSQKNVNTRKTESSRLKISETPKPKTTSSVITKTITNKTKLNASDKLNVTPRTNLSKITTKSSKTSSLGTSIKSTTNLPLKGTKSLSRDVTSKRVTKEQYFPKKYPFSSYLHENDEVKSDRKGQNVYERKATQETSIKQKKEVNKTSKNRERTVTRTLSPSEIQVIKTVQEKNKTSDEEIPVIQDNRPRTATIRKHESNNGDVNFVKGISRPENTVTSVKMIEKNMSNSEDNDYEDDFDSYESDFEVDSASTLNSSTSDIETNSTTSNSSISTSKEENLTELTQKRISSAGNEEERKLDSGNYDLPDVKHKQILDKIKEAVERENLNLNKFSSGETVSNLTSLSDEGFEDGSKHSLINTGFINFMDARKKQQLKKQNMKSRKRGDDLMGMIRLNHVSFSLFDMKAISYESFMQSYGKTGTIQMSCQTGDDNIDEEIQTEPIELISKSTQFPIRFSKTEDYFLSKEHSDKENKLILQNSITVNKNLNQFLEKASKLILYILDHKQIKSEQITKKNEQELPFSDGYFNLNFDNVPFIKKRAITYMTYTKLSKFLTVHESNIQTHMDQNRQLLSRSMICIWNISDPHYPQFILASSGDITKACFDSNFGYLIFAGICDGSINVWDLREEVNLHKEIFDEETNKLHVIRSPTYTAVAMLDGDQNSSKIISVQSYYEKNQDNTNDLNYTHLAGIQIASLDEMGLIIIWSVIQKQATPELLSDDQGLVPWGCILLVQGLTISLQKLNPNLKELQCFDLQFNEADFNHLYIASNYGILHCISTGMKPKPKLYSSDKSPVNCIAMAPFSCSYFLSGCENGNIQLHSRFYEKPLMTLCSTDEQNKLNENTQIIEWATSRPCVFFVKDISNNIHIWDLTASDLYPIYSIPFTDKIFDIKFLPVMNKQNLSYMAIASKNYGVQIHSVKKNFSQITPEQYKTELNIFLNYANRL